MVVAEEAAEPARLKPITMMIGPTTSAGKICSIQAVPVKVTMKATTKYTSPTEIIPCATAG